jgi:hypothetical protein
MINFLQLMFYVCWQEFTQCASLVALPNPVIRDSSCKLAIHRAGVVVSLHVGYSACNQQFT